MNGTSFFDYDQFMPHGMCYLWQPEILWTSVISDVVTALAYYSITAAVIMFVKQRKDLQYPWFFILAGSVIFMACGTSHLISAVVIWEPIYGVSSIVKAITAISSLATGVVIWYVIPFFLSLPSPSMLEAKVKSRTEELANSNDLLNKEVNEHKLARNQLVQLKNYMHNIIDSMPSVLIGVDLSGKVTQWNRAAQESTGTKSEEVIGQSLAQSFPRLSTVMEQIRQAVKTRDQQNELKRPFHQEGMTHYEDMTIYPLIENGVEGVVIRLDDVTERVRMSEMMIQSEKMLSVGGLAAGMAHEINNPLAGMMQTAEVMKNRLTSVDMPANVRLAEEAGIDLEAMQQYMRARGIFRMVDDIHKSGQRVASIVDNMLSFARKSESIFSSYDLGELLDKALELAATDYDLKKHYDFKNINIVRLYEDGLPMASCEASKIQQVLLNVLRNGAQAMQEAEVEKATFTFRTRYEPGRGTVCLEIEDNGPGMDEFTRKRVFDPFFTTKPVGVGTGLGLSVSYFIITENHGGEMSVESEPGKGTQFIIRLPVTSVNTTVHSKL